eukprot:221938_1
MTVTIIDNYLVFHCLDNAYYADIYKALSITRITISSIVLILTIFIGISAFKEMQKCDKLYKSLKYLFYISIIFCIIRCIAAIIADVLCVYFEMQTAAISVDIVTVASYFLLVLTLLATLLVRLNTTFQNSIYEISKIQNIAFICLFTIISSLSITAIIFYGTISMIYHDIELDGNVTVYDRITTIFILSGLAIALYLFAATWAVVLFTNRLLSLINSRQDTIRNLNNIRLNTFQYKLIDQISKYNALFSLATFTSVLTITVMIIAALIPRNTNDVEWFVNGLQIISIISTIDAFLNIICLYLQYKFASKYYNKYCKYCDLCWKSIFTNSVTKSLQRKSVQITEKDNKHINDSNGTVATKLNKERIKTYSESECIEAAVNDALIQR